MLVAFYRYTGRKGIVGIVDRLNRWWTGGPYTHTELIFSSGEWFSSTVAEAGVRFKKIDLDLNKWDFLRVDVTADEEAEMWEWAQDRQFRNGLRRRYDFLGVFLSVILPLDTQDKSRDYCNETVHLCFQWVGKFCDVKANSMNPNSFYKNLLKNGARRV